MTVPPAVRLTPAEAALAGHIARAEQPAVADAVAEAADAGELLLALGRGRPCVALLRASTNGVLAVVDGVEALVRRHCQTVEESLAHDRRALEVTRARAEPPHARGRAPAESETEIERAIGAWRAEAEACRTLLEAIAALGLSRRARPRPVMAGPAPAPLAD